MLLRVLAFDAVLLQDARQTRQPSVRFSGSIKSFSALLAAEDLDVILGNAAATQRLDGCADVVGLIDNADDSLQRVAQEPSSTGSGSHAKAPAGLSVAGAAR